MEEERNIEKELRAYARQRRSDAGAMPELHPATRKLLQDEAARASKSAGAGRRSGRRTFWNSWRRLAATGFAAAAIALMCWILLPAHPMSKVASEPLHMASAQNKDELYFRDSKVPPADVIKSVAQREIIGKPPGVPAPASPAPVAAPVTTAPAVADAPEVERFAGTAKSSLRLSDRSLEQVNAAGAIRPPVRTDNTPFSAEAPVTPIVQGFQQIGLPQTRERSPTTASNVLMSFQVEQALEKLRMIDSDGSVYTGFVQQTPETGKQPAELQKAAEDKSLGLRGADATKQSARAFWFRVSGTNRTLNEEVVFTGNFLITNATNALAPGASSAALNRAVGGAAASPKTGELPLLELHTARVEGRVLLNKTNTIEINAVPVKH